ncbi:hypothetical protein LXA43DRAFT_1067176 [Ganoderma leucocontextum]|nr:hypothetical protein LXA43DRAFT_1067176 [Ganoderma leucocontextum]
MISCFTANSVDFATRPETAVVHIDAWIPAQVTINDAFGNTRRPGFTYTETGWLLVQSIADTNIKILHSNAITEHAKLAWNELTHTIILRYPRTLHKEGNEYKLKFKQCNDFWNCLVIYVKSRMNTDGLNEPNTNCITTGQTDRTISPHHHQRQTIGEHIGSGQAGTMTMVERTEPTETMGAMGTTVPTAQTGMTGTVGHVMEVTGQTGPMIGTGATSNLGPMGPLYAVGGMGLMGTTGMTGPSGSSGPMYTGMLGPTGMAGPTASTALSASMGYVGQVGQATPTPAQQTGYFGQIVAPFGQASTDPFPNIVH